MAGLTPTIAGLLYRATPSLDGFMSSTDKTKLNTLLANGSIIPARCVLTGTLPAYTKTGSAGSEVLTANANGALAAAYLDGVTGITGDIVLVAYNATSTADAGIFTLTQGTGGTPWVLTRTTTDGLNTAARLQGSTVRTTEGFEAGYWMCTQNTITVGTTPLLWRPPGPPSGKRGFYANAQFSERGAIIVYTANATPATLSNGNCPYQGYAASALGALASISNTQSGGGTFQSGTAVNGIASMDSQQADFSLARLDVEFFIRFEIPQVSDGGGTFSVSIGLLNDANNFSKILLTPTAAADINHVTTVAGVAGATRLLAAGGFAINTIFRYVLRKPFGATVYQIWFDPGTGVLAYVADTPAIPTTLSAGAIVLKSAAAGARSMTVHEMVTSVYDPKVWG